MCTLTAPNQYNGPFYRFPNSQTVPNNTICDYIILNIKQSPDGSYNGSSYMFLRAHTNRYLFTLDNSVTFHEMKDRLLKQPFMTSVNKIREILDLHGFGFFTLDTTDVLDYTDTDIDFLKLIFQHLNQILNKLGVLTPFNFFSFKLENPRLTLVEYATFLDKINGIASIVIIFTTTDVQSLQPQPSTAWNLHCLYSFIEPTLEDALNLIYNVPEPLNRFALTLSLRMDVYRKTDLSDIYQTSPDETLAEARSDQHLLRNFDEECYPAVYRNDPTGYYFKYLSKGCCNFAKYTGQAVKGVASFETSRSIEDKMTSSKSMLQQLGIHSTHIVGWLAHDVTFNLARELCGGKANRLLKMRELVP
ncbi:uncharacterized protein [Dermacentor albipictus]|uniref:uncharacterized protein isoform X1 n=1 Tax=Dermacentor albipictus TaxID=60249 RepID=UPI0038FC77EA